MRVGLLTGSVSRRAGGLFASLRGLAKALVADAGVEVQVFGLGDDASPEDVGAWGGVPVHVADVVGPPGLYSAVRRADLDVLHVACTWMYPTLVSLRWRRATGRPVVVAPHGDLDPWALANARWKKAVAATLFERRHLSAAAALQALNEAEARAFRAFGLTNPIAVIANGVELPAAAKDAPAAAWSLGLPAGAKVLLALGRLHPKKNLAALIEAWARVDAGEPAAARRWWLAIAGSGTRDHMARLARHAGDMGAARVRFVGAQHGGEKDASFRRASAFVLPSLSEGLPMAVLEAWSYGLPVLMTRACNLPEGRLAGAAIESEASVAALAGGLRRLFAVSDDERADMGAAGRRLVEHRFAWPGVAAEMRALYGWLAEGGPPPSRLLVNSGEEAAPPLAASAA